MVDVEHEAVRYDISTAASVSSLGNRRHGAVREPVDDALDGLKGAHPSEEPSRLGDGALTLPRPRAVRGTADECHRRVKGSHAPEVETVVRWFETYGAIDRRQLGIALQHQTQLIFGE